MIEIASSLAPKGQASPKKIEKFLRHNRRQAILAESRIFQESHRIYRPSSRSFCSFIFLPFIAG